MSNIRGFGGRGWADAFEVVRSREGGEYGVIGDGQVLLRM